MVMRTKQRRQSNRGRWLVPCIAVAFLSYFGFHVVNGDLGLNSRVKLEQKRGQLEDKLSNLVAERKEMERRASLLKSGTINKDMLDEQARILLEVARPDDIVIFRKPLAAASRDTR